MSLRGGRIDPLLSYYAKESYQTMMRMPNALEVQQEHVYVPKAQTNAPSRFNKSIINQRYILINRQDHIIPFQPYSNNTSQPTLTMKGLLRRPRRNLSDSSTAGMTADSTSNLEPRRNLSDSSTAGMTADNSNSNLEEAYKLHRRNMNKGHRWKRNKQDSNAINLPENVIHGQDSDAFDYLSDDGNGTYKGRGQSEMSVDTSSSQPIIAQNEMPDSPTTSGQTKGPRKAMTDAAIKKDESKLKKAGIRLFFGFLMVFIFLSVVYLGHIYLCGLIFFTEVMLFRELVKVRYNTFFHIIEETIPLFRTTQWLWFWTSIFFTYSDFVVDVIKGNTSLHYLLSYARFHTGFAFLLYSGTFVLTIATMQKGYIRFQINQLCWTCLVLCLTVGQLKYIMHNVYNGLFWFTLPIMLVVSNDSFAWLAGITCGRKFIHREFISFSPNKTWEGFIGGWLGTMIFGWYLARFMAQYTWMICPATTFSLFPGSLECEPNPIFQPATNIVPSQIFELIPYGLVQMIPGGVNICMVDVDSHNLTACISGEPSHTHHHFELIVKNLYPVQIHALGLGLFASFVAPFGGFLASAIKRAYGLKDFANFIPGHGGIMDRMDCQLLMALCTWVHYNTFVTMATVSVPKMIYMYKLMKESEQEEFLRRIAEM